MNKKILLCIGVISIFLVLILKYDSRNENNFVYIIPQIKYTEVLDRNIGEYSIFTLNGTQLDFKTKNFISGKLFFNVPNGEYLLKIDYDNKVKYVPFVKNDAWKKIIIHLQGDIFSRNQKIVLNAVTLALIILNFNVYIKIKDHIKKDKVLNISFFLLMAKLFFSIKGDIQNNFMVITDFSISFILGCILILYVLNHMLDKKFKKMRIFVYILLTLTLFHYVIICVNLIFPKVYAHLSHHHEIILIFLQGLYKFINLRRIILIILLFNLIINKKFAEFTNKFYWIAIIAVYFFLEFFYLLFPKAINLYYFIRLIEYMCIYWGICFVNLRIYNQNINRVVRYILGFTISYIVLFYFKTLKEPFLILFTIFILDFYTEALKKIMVFKDKNIEKAYNKLCLAQNELEFKEELKKEIQKNINIKSVNIKLFFNNEAIKEYIYELDFPEDDLYIEKDNIKDEKYSFGIRLAFNKNPCVGIIFIEEGSTSLSVEEIRYLFKLAENISSIASNIRLNSIYKEISFYD